MVVQDLPSTPAENTARQSPSPGHSEHDWKTIVTGPKSAVNWCLNCGTEEPASRTQLDRMAGHGWLDGSHHADSGLED